MALGKKTGGRQAGTPNKATGTAREAIARLADGRAKDLSEWLAMTAYGVGKAYIQIALPHDQEGPKGGYVLATTKSATIWAKPIGKEPTITLLDIIEGRVPAEAVVKWIVPPDPGESTRTMIGALEFHMPKMSRVEATGLDGKDLIPATIEIIGVPAQPVSAPRKPRK